MNSASYRSDTIEAIGLVIVELLEELTNPPVDVLQATPADPNNSNAQLCLFLYNASPHPFLNNQEFANLNHETQQYPPLMMELKYLLIPYGNDEQARKNLGEAVRVLYEYALIPERILAKKDYPAYHEQPRITFNTLTLDDINKLWSLFPNQPYRLSFGFSVSPVQIDAMRRVSTKRVVERDLDYRYIALKSDDQDELKKNDQDRLQS